MPGNGAAASYGDLLITSLVVLAGVCIAAFIVVKVVGRFLATGRMRGAHLLDVVARLPLEPRRSLYVVEVAGKTLLVGTSEMGLSVLSELDGEEVKARAVPKQSFGELVRSAWMKRRSFGASGATPAVAFSAGDREDVSAETSRARVGAATVRGAESVSAHVGSSRGGRGDDVLAETREASQSGILHGGSRGAPGGDVSAETREASKSGDAHVKATARGASESASAHVGARGGDVSAKTRDESSSSAHVGAKEREKS